MRNIIVAQLETTETIACQTTITPAGRDAQFRAFFEQGSNFAALLNLDGSIVEMNRVSLELGGYARDEVIGRPFWACRWWSHAPDLMEAARAATLEAAHGATVRRLSAYRALDDSERYADVTITPVSADDGRILFLAATGVDVTERRLVAQRLRLLDEIGEATRIAVEPRAIMAEATRLLGEHLGVTRVAYADLEPDNDRFTIRHDWREEGAMSTAGTYSLDLFGSRATSNLRVGRTLLVSDVDAELAAADGADMFNAIGIKAIICCPLVKGGRLVAMMAVHQRDPRAWTSAEVALVEAVVERCWAHIERVRATEALVDADRRKSEFLATLAHELRNPLAPIRNGLELLRLGSARPEQQANVRAMMERQVGHMVHLINDLLDIARVASGKVVLQVAPLAVRDVVASAVETSLPLIEASRHTLEIDLPPDAIADRGRCRAPEPGAEQPAVERGQVHAAGRAHPGGGAARGR